MSSLPLDEETDTKSPALIQGRMLVDSALLASALPDLYDHNPFRLTGLPVDASYGEIRAQSKQLQLTLKFAEAPEVPAINGWLVKRVEPTVIHDAIQRLLMSPESRLIQEIFWFWDTGTSLGMRAIGRSDEAMARAAWMQAEQQSPPSLNAQHDLAVLDHMKALLLEIVPTFPSVDLPPANSPLRENQRDVSWRRSLWRWRSILSDEVFWDRLRARIEKLADPRLTQERLKELQAALPAFVLTINVRLAIKYATGGRFDDAKRVMVIGRLWSETSPLCASCGRALDAAPMPSNLVCSACGSSEVLPALPEKPTATLIDELLRDELAPIVLRVKGLCGTARTAANADRPRVESVITRLLAEVEPLMSIIAALVPRGSDLLLAAHDLVADTVLGCVIMLSNLTEQYSVALNFLKQIRYYGDPSPRLELRITEAFEKVTANAESAIRWCQEDYYTLPSSTLEFVERARDRAAARKWDDALAILVDIAMGRRGHRLSEKHQRIVGHALAACLCMRAYHILNKAAQDMLLSGGERRRDAESQAREDLQLALEVAGMDHHIRELVGQMGGASGRSTVIVRLRMGLLKGDVLKEALESADHKIRLEAARMLRTMDATEERVQALLWASTAHNYPHVSDEIAVALQKMLPDGMSSALVDSMLPGLIATTVERNRGFRERQRALELLCRRARAKPDVLVGLIPLLADPDDLLRKTAVGLFVELQSATIGVLDDAFNAEMCTVRSAIARVFSQCGTAGRDVLLRAVRQGPRAAQLAAMSELTETPGEEVLSVIIAQLGHDEETRAAASLALQRRRDKRALDPLFGCLIDPATVSVDPILRAMSSLDAAWYDTDVVHGRIASLMSDAVGTVPERRKAALRAIAAVLRLRRSAGNGAMSGPLERAMTEALSDCSVEIRHEVDLELAGTWFPATPASNAAIEKAISAAPTHSEPWPPLPAVHTSDLHDPIWTGERPRVSLERRVFFLVIVLCLAVGFVAGWMAK